MNKAKAVTVLTDYDITLMQGGNHCRLYQKMGAQEAVVDDEKGITFAVYAPAARRVSVIGNFNQWQAGKHELFPKWDSSGVWEGFIPGLQPGALYKYAIESHSGFLGVKADPYARFSERPPMTASIIWKDQYSWKDDDWMKNRIDHNRLGVPMSIYELHFASWKRKENGDSLTYREMAAMLPAYLKEMNFTHVEFMPVMEHPYDPSWGYQITGYYAPTSRYGTPDDLKFLIDALHQAGIGVILDWVPSHFPTDGHGLGFFDGSHVYESEDPRKGFHQDWQSLIFNYGRNEVRSFLISNALYWVDEFHTDGLRVDAVASMIYLDYSRKEGEWEPNAYGGRENLEAIAFLKSMNETIYQYHPDIMMIAEESTAFEGVSRPTYDGGLGFGMKWMMGWMHDTLNYFKTDPLFRKSVHDKITFSLIYNYSENYILPFSHDEVVHGKGSLLTRMPGTGQDQFANLRLMLGYMFTHPGAKLLFMGGEFGQRREWDFAGELEWKVLQFESHKGIQAWVKAVNALYRHEKSLHERCTQPEGFQWVRVDDWQQSVLAYERIAADPTNKILVILNMTPVDRDPYRIGTKETGSWTLIDHSDRIEYWGQGRSVKTKVNIEKKTWEHKSHSMEFKLPGLTILIYRFNPAKPVPAAKKSGRKTTTAKKAGQEKKSAPPKPKTAAKKSRPVKKTLKKSIVPAKKTSRKSGSSKSPKR